MNFLKVLKECKITLIEASLMQIIRTLENNPNLELSSIPSGPIQLSSADKKLATLDDVDKLINNSYIENNKKPLINRMLRNLINVRNANALDRAVNDFKTVYDKKPRPSFGR